MYACQKKLKRLVAIIDQNGIGCDGPVEQMVQMEPFDSKWSSFGFKVEETNGHDAEKMNQLFLRLREEGDGPYAVIAHTIKGHGLIREVEGTGACHYISGTREALNEMFAF